MKCAVANIADGIEIKANGNQVLVPPSIYPDTGTAYQWSVDSAAQIADAPQWLLDLATRQAEQKRQSRGGTGAVADNLAVAAGVDDGQRDVTIAKLAGHLLRRFVDPRVVLELMGAWNEVRVRPPLPADDIFRIVNSVSQKK